MSAQAEPMDDDVTLSAIRSVLTEPVEVSAPAAMAKPAQHKAAPIAAKPDRSAVEKAETPDLEHLSKPSLIDRIRRVSYRPSRKLLVWAGFLILVFLFPHVFVISAIVLVFVIGGAFAILGGDAVWGFAMRRFDRFADVAPERANRFAKRMDAFAYRWDQFLDRFPDGSVDGLYLPAFQAHAKADAQHTAAMSDRLARMQQGAQA